MKRKMLVIVTCIGVVSVVVTLAMYVVKKIKSKLDKLTLYVTKLQNDMVMVHATLVHITDMINNES